MSSISLQDSQVQFYDAIEYFTSDSESDDDSDQDSDADVNEGLSNKQKTPAIVPGLFILFYFYVHINSIFLSLTQNISLLLEFF